MAQGVNGYAGRIDLGPLCVFLEYVPGRKVARCTILVIENNSNVSFS